MARIFNFEKLGPENLTFLFPREITERLNTFAAAFGLDLSTAPKRAVSKEQMPEVLELLLFQVFLAPHTEPPAQRVARLPSPHQEHLAWLLHRSLMRAAELERAQPDTPLGFPRGPRGVVSNLLAASWLDLTEGGKQEFPYDLVD